MSNGIYRVALANVLDSEGRRGDHFVDLRPMTGRNLIALSASDDDIAPLIAQLGAAVVAHDFTDAEGEPADILDQPWETLQGALSGWRVRSEEDALPQA